MTTNTKPEAPAELSPVQIIESRIASALTSARDALRIATEAGGFDEAAAYASKAARRFAKAAALADVRIALIAAEQVVQKLSAPTLKPGDLEAGVMLNLAPSRMQPRAGVKVCQSPGCFLAYGHADECQEAF